MIRCVQWGPAVIMLALALLILYAAPNRNRPREILLDADCSSVLILRNSASFVIGRRDGVVEQRNFDGNHISVKKLGEGSITQLSADKSESRVVIVSRDGNLLVVDSQTLKVRHRFFLDGMTRAAISPGGTRLAAGRQDGSVWFCDLDEGVWKPLEPAHLKLVTATAWSQSGRYLATGSQAGTVFVWDAESGKLVLTATEPHSTIMQVGFDADEKTLMVVHFNQTLSRFDLASGVRTSQRIDSSHTLFACFSESGDMLVTVGRRGRVTLRDASGYPVQILQYLGGTEANGCLRDGQMALAGGGNRVLIWDLKQLKSLNCGGLLLVLFLASLLGTGLTSLIDWRLGLLYCVLLDGLRDPVRKLFPDAPVWITLTMGGLWMLVALLAARDGRSGWQEFFRSPGRRNLLALTGLLLFSAMIRSIVTFEAGWQMVILGWSAYLAPVAGMLIGLTFLRSDDDLRRFSVVYVIGHLLLSCASFIEFRGWDWRGLEGIDFDWIRYYSDGLISLMSGFYRSPTVLGIHAAGVVMYGGLLALQSRRQRRMGWLLAAVLGAFVLLIAGRRKMQLIVVLFAITVAVTVARRALRLHTRTFCVSIVLAIISAALTMSVLTSRQGLMPDYVGYASTLGREGIQRTWGLTSSVWVTFDQSGLWGRGLGTATQGSYRFRGAAPYAWQEDGLARIAAELGVPGLVLFGIGCVWLLTGLIRCVQRTSPRHRRVPVLLAGMVVGYLGSYIADHMTFSGDVSTSILAAMPLGMLITWSRLHAHVAVRPE